jgi:catechol 2,3-dioxygenase-like lactoylglutathione lyase family enzyme
MTQIRSMTQPVQKRPGELGVHSLHHFNFIVPDLVQAEKFYSDFGLNLKEENGALILYTHGHPHRWGSLSEGARKKLQFISFGAYEEDMPKFRERLEQMRLDRLDPPKGFESNGLWFHDPDGILVEIRVAEKSSPNAKTTFDMIGGEVGRQNAPNRSKAHKVQPRRLAHILLFTQDIPKAIAFYRDMLGLRLSDRSGDLIAFMHGIHGSDHHMIASREVRGSWPAPLQLGCRLDQRHWGRRDLHGRQGIRLRLGSWSACPRFQLLPLHPRSVGQLFRILLRHRLHPGRQGLAGGRSTGRRFVLHVGPEPAAGLRL